MLAFGSYEARRELASAGFCARYEAALAADASLSAAKAFGSRFVATAVGPSVVVPWLPRAGLDEEARRLVGAARDQSQLVGAGAKRWSVIADFGLMDDGRGAYVVRPSPAWTLERLALVRYRPSSVELRAIILGVVEGLLELERLADRPWGLLQSSSIHLAGPPGDAKLSDPSGVTLTDLEARERLPDDAAVADVRALGRLVYELVLHKRPPLKAAGGWVATWSDDWLQLGDGRFWFDLTNRLMGAGSVLGAENPAPSLAVLRQTLVEHKPHRPLPKRQIFMAAAAAALAVVVGGGVVVYQSMQVTPVEKTADQLEEAARLARWQGLVDRWRFFGGDLYASRASLADLARNQPGSSTMSAIAAALSEADLRDPREIAGAAAGASLLDLRDRPGDAIEGDKIVAAAASSDRLDELRRLMLEWPELRRLPSVAEQWTARGWELAAQSLDGAGAEITRLIPPLTTTTLSSEPGPGEVTAALVAAQRVIDDATSIESSWEWLTREAEASKEGGDPTLATLAEMGAAEARAALTGDATPPAPEAARAALRARLGELEERGVRAIALDRGRVEGWDREGFREQAKQDPTLTTGTPGRARLDAWLTLAESDSFAKVDAPDPRQPALERVRGAIESLTESGRRLSDMQGAGRDLSLSVDEFERRLARLRADSDVLERTAWSNRNRAKVESGSAALLRGVDALERDVSDALVTGPMSLPQAIASLDRDLFRAPSLRADWLATLERARASENKKAAFALVRERRDQLLAMDQAVPVRAELPEALRGSFDAARWERAYSGARDALLARLLPALANGGMSSESVDAGPPQDARRAMDAWLAGATEDLERARDVKQRLTRGEERGLSADLDAQVATLLASPRREDLRPVLESIEAALARLDSIAASNDAAELVRTANEDSDFPSVALAAWARLSQLPWPRDAAQFDQAGELASRVLPALIASRIDSVGRAEVESRVAARARVMWLSYFESRRPEDRDQIGAALARAGRFGVAPATERELSPESRYNAMLWSLAREAREFESQSVLRGETPLDEQTREVGLMLERLRVQAPAGVLEQPPAAALVNALRVIAERRARPPFDPLVNGPASVRSPSTGRPLWRAQREGEAIVFTLDVPIARTTGLSNVRITFLPVDVRGPGGPIATYVSTTEVSVAQFVGAVEAARAWDQVREVLRRWEADKADPRIGPATWTWDRSRSRVIVSTPDLRENEVQRQGRAVRLEGRSSRRESNGWIPVPEALVGLAFYPAELEPVPAPVADSPMNWVSPDAAVLAARLMGSRVPTIAEWKSAVEQAGPLPELVEQANLRDKFWKLQFDFVSEGKRIEMPWPHAGAFWPKGLRPEWSLPANRRGYVDANDNAAVERTDGVLWFAPGSSESDAFQHLVGNVAELVVDAPAERLSAVPPRAAEVRAAVESLGAEWRVIGGSALSGLTLRGDRPFELAEPYEFQSLRDARNAYSDLGFRLAFGEGGEGRPVEPPATLAAQALSAAPYLRPTKGEAPR